MTDLDKLIEAVEGNRSIGSKDYIDAIGHDLFLYAVEAYHGSLDAAKALHEALLPDWTWCVDGSGYAISAYEDMDGETGMDADNPARAWLLATLKAYRAQVQK